MNQSKIVCRYKTIESILPLVDIGPSFGRLTVHDINVIYDFCRVVHCV